MKKNLIDMTIAAEDKTTIGTHVTGLETVTEFMISMDPLEKKRLLNAGPKSDRFAELALTGAKLNPDIMPAKLDVAKLERDQVSLQFLRPLEARLASLLDRCRDTIFALEVDSMNGSLVAYKVLQALGRSEGMDALLEQLQQRFARKNKKKDAEKPPTPPVPPASSTEMPEAGV